MLPWYSSITRSACTAGCVTIAVAELKYNVVTLAKAARALAADVYAPLDMPFAVLVGQIASALTKK
jgi:hypothetical protein